jgi:hypothetical protein
MGVGGIDDDARLGIVVRTPSSRPICFTSTALHFQAARGVLQRAPNRSLHVVFEEDSGAPTRSPP